MLLSPWTVLHGDIKLVTLVFAKNDMRIRNNKTCVFYSFRRCILSNFVITQVFRRSFSVLLISAIMYPSHVKR